MLDGLDKVSDKGRPKRTQNGQSSGVGRMHASCPQPFFCRGVSRLVTYLQPVTFLSHIRGRLLGPTDPRGGFRLAARLRSTIFATLGVLGNPVRDALSTFLAVVPFSTILLANLLTSPVCRGDIAENPYLGIPERNAFGIKPPPPPPPEPKAIEVPKPPANVTLTGFSEFDDGKIVYLMFNLPGAKTPEYSSLHEGDAQNGVEILQIDLASETVRIRQNGTESTLDYKSNGNKAAPGPGGPAVPGQPPAFVAPRAPSGGPVVIRRGGVAETQGAPSYPTSPGGGGGSFGAFPGSPNFNQAVPTSGRAPDNSMGGGRVIPVPPPEMIPHPRNPNLPPIPLPPVPPSPGGLPNPQ